MQEKEPMFASERQNRILAILQRDKKIFVRELSDILSVSAVTVRNDLRELEDKGALVRTHGGAIPASNTGFEENSARKRTQSVVQKKAIAKEAVKHVQDGDTIALDTGTTALAFAEELVDKKGLTVITTDVKIALFLEENTDATVILLGGILRRGYNCTLGSITEMTMAQFYADKCFMATNGLTASAGATTPNSEQASIKRMMIEHSNQVILLCNGDKLGRNSLCSFLPIKDVHLLITDEGADENEICAIKQQGVEVKCVSV